MGTCAGLIVLAKRVEGGVPCLATMDITGVRNAYGRQLVSFETVAPCVCDPGSGHAYFLDMIVGR